MKKQEFKGVILIKSIFIAGPIAIRKLDDKVIKKLKDIKDGNNKVHVGDANGVDKLIQNFFSNNKYDNVEVFASEGKARNNLGRWNVNSVDVDKSLKGFDYYTQKDKAMAKESDYGFMIWNGKSRGTLNNMINLRIEQKEILLFFTPTKQFYYITEDSRLPKIVSGCEEKTQEIYKELLKNKENKKIQQLKMNISYDMDNINTRNSSYLG